MGAFLLFKNTIPENRVMEAIKTFDIQGLPFNGIFNLGKYKLYLYGKLYFNQKNYIEYENGDFAATTGSLVYKGKSGSEALFDLLKDYKERITIEDKIKGNYFVLLKTGERLILFRDYYGLYPVYVNADYSLVTSSFLCASVLTSSVNIRKDELYEYLFKGYWFGEETIFEEIRLLKPKGIHSVFEKTYHLVRPHIDPVKGNTLNDYVKAISYSLKEHFSSLINPYNQIRMGLSGGYDSRLMLAVLLSIGEYPSLYVNGTPESVDMKCAGRICKGLNLPLERVHYYIHYDEFEYRREELFTRRFHFFDGLGVNGLFDNYSDLEYLLSKTNLPEANFNGAGGEIFREAWNIPRVSTTYKTFVRGYFDKVDSRIFNNYSKRDYLSNIEKKVATEIGKKEEFIKREDIEYLHPMRYKAIQFILSAQQRLLAFHLPFYEFQFIEDSLTIPLKYKYDAKLNRNLIQSLQPVLADFISSYGYTMSGKIPLNYRAKESLVRSIPLYIRPILRRYKKSKKLAIADYGKDLSSEEMIHHFVGNEPRGLNSYINTKYVNDKLIISRINTVEYLLKYIKEHGD